MEVKQSKVPTFFINNDKEDETLAYIEKNAPLLKGHLLLFKHEISLDLKERCEAWKLCFTHNTCGIKNKLDKDKNSLSNKPETAKENVEAEKLKAPKKEVFKTIRSGETLSFDGDLVIVGNVNDGATITSEGTLAIFGIIEGDISCGGSYLILSACNRGKVIFQGEVINDLIKGSQLKMFYKQEQELKIKELI